MRSWSCELAPDTGRQTVPGDVQDTLKKRISELNRSKIVARIDDLLLRLQCADLMDYHKLIDNNWAWFVDRFGMSGRSQIPFLGLEELPEPSAPCSRQGLQLNALAWKMRSKPNGKNRRCIPNQGLLGSAPLTMFE